jgi:Tfp pilus assembly protein PilE
MEDFNMVVFVGVIFLAMIFYPAFKNYSDKIGNEGVKKTKKAFNRSKEQLYMIKEEYKRRENEKDK